MFTERKTKLLNLNLKAKVKSAILLSRQRPDLFFFCLLVFFLPSQLGYHLWPEWSLVSGIRVDFLAPTIFFVDILVFLLITSWIAQKPKLKINIKVLLLVIIFAVLNIVNSISWQESLYKWLRVGELSALSYWVFCNKERVVLLIKKPLTLAIVLSLCLAIVQILTAKTVGGVFYFFGERTFNISTPGIALVRIFDKFLLRPYASFSHPNVLGGFSLAAYFLGVSVSLPTVFLSFSQAATGAFILTALFREFLLHLRKQLILTFILLSVLLMPVGSLMIRSSVSLPETIQKRLELANVAGVAFSQSPFLGLGLGDFIKFIPQAKESSSLWFLQPVHNIFLLVLSETGAVGLFLFVYLLFKLKGRTQLLFAILFTGFFDHYWLTLIQSQLLFAIVVGILFENEKTNN